MQKYSLSKLSDVFYKQAVDMPEWVPSRLRDQLKPYTVKKNEKFKDFTIDGIKAEDIEDVNSPQFEQFKANLITNITGLYIIAEFINLDLKDHNEHSEKLKKAENMLVEFKQQIEASNEPLYFNKVLLNKNVYKISKAYNMLREIVSDIAFDVMDKYGANRTTKGEVASFKEFDEILFKKSWDDRFVASANKKYKIVFTTNPENIIGMSSRSAWKSCQNIFGESETGKSAIDSIIGTVLCEDIAMIYLTDSEQYKRNNVVLGDKIIYRRMVYLVYDDEGNEFALLQRQYPNINDKIAKLFENAITEKLGLPAIVSENNDKITFIDNETLPEKIRDNGNNQPYTDYYKYKEKYDESNDTYKSVNVKTMIVNNPKKYVELYKKLTTITKNDIPIKANTILSILKKRENTKYNNRNEALAVAITDELKDLILIFIKSSKIEIFEFMDEKGVTNKTFKEFILFITRTLLTSSQNFSHYSIAFLIPIFKKYNINITYSEVDYIMSQIGTAHPTD